eukprot:10796905-Alexandrium_andersonii.AAC.1
MKVSGFLASPPSEQQLWIYPSAPALNMCSQRVVADQNWPVAPRAPYQTRCRAPQSPVHSLALTS